MQSQDYLPSITRAKPVYWKVDNPDLPELPDEDTQTLRAIKFDLSNQATFHPEVWCAK
jgi:hypothetical protein